MAQKKEISQAFEGMFSDFGDAFIISETEQPKEEKKEKKKKQTAKQTAPKLERSEKGIILATRVPADFFDEWSIYSAVRSGGKKGAKGELLVAALTQYMEENPLTGEERKAGAILTKNR